MTAETSVRVSFVDAASGTCFAQADVPASQLPDSFEARTTLRLQDAEWEVLRADPVTRAEYERSRELRLELARITVGAVPTGDLLFSLPTICDFIPGVAAGTTKLGKQVLELHEDDWRQVELVAASLRAEVGAELAAVRAIYDHDRDPGGAFRKLHVRKEPAVPLAGRDVLLADLGRALPSLTPLDGVAYQGVAGLIEGGFALRSPSGLCLYGTHAGGAVTVLGVVPPRAGQADEQEAGALAALMRRHDLFLIDWCRVHAVPGNDTDVSAYLHSR